MTSAGSPPRLPNCGVLYHGLDVLGGGATLAGVVFGAIAVCIIDRTFEKAAAFALVGTLLTFFGFMHGEAIGIAKSPAVALSYLGIAAILLAYAKDAVIAPAPAAIDHAHAMRPAE